MTGNIDDAVVQEFNTCSKKFKDRFEVLDRNGCDISYDSMENDVFESNLQLIDGDLPKICGYMNLRRALIFLALTKMMIQDI